MTKHEKTCFKFRLEAGMKIWDSRNEEPGEYLSEDEWQEWYQKRCSAEKRGIEKLCKELNVKIDAPAGLEWLGIPCTCGADVSS